MYSERGKIVKIVDMKTDYLPTELASLYSALPTFLFFLSVLIFILFTLALTYHVLQYTINTKRAKLAVALYLIISGALLLAASIALLNLN